MRSGRKWCGEMGRCGLSPAMGVRDYVVLRPAQPKVSNHHASSSALVLHRTEEAAALESRIDSMRRTLERLQKEISCMRTGQPWTSSEEPKEKDPEEQRKLEATGHAHVQLDVRALRGIQGSWQRGATGTPAKALARV